MRENTKDKVRRCARSAPALLLVLGGSLLGAPAIAQSQQQTEVQQAIDALWVQAGKLDVDQSFGVSVPNEAGFYVLDGQVVWLREDTLALYRETFGAASKNDINMTDERITVLAEDLALYVAAGSYNMEDASGASMGSGPMALTIIMKKDHDVWKILHLHQSFPAMN
ncbi:nuclear transport factor 2 family protein [Ruegeria sp. HKCCA5763]|uniref:nuclear transport factor 2 family protein n=1 Tax=Ruegeria sp. HKCCA5763 TaxID=2682987 RepID=UPI0014880521|nr:nuclear transport factor 2 family protein [Ruegeria sp. HKCCA5763]